jgi:NodT family efflux transporter outer membrane factor (OMF) lipoprotein
MGKIKDFFRGEMNKSILFLAFALSSCASVNTSFSKVKTEKGVLLENVANNALESDSFIKGDWPDEKWWEIYRDDQLSSLIEEGLKNSPALSSIEAKVRQANQEAFVVRSKLFPQLSAFFNVLWIKQNSYGFPAFGFPGNVQLYTLAMDFDYEFDFWKKNQYAYEAVLGESRVKEAMKKEEELVLSTAISSQYFDCMANMIKINIMEEIVANRRRLLELVKLRKQNRIDNLLNINQMSEQLVILQEGLVAIQGDLELQKSLINRLIGRNPDEKLQIERIWNLDLEKLQIPNSMGLHLLAHRPDLIAGVWQITAEAKRIGVAFGEFFPDIDFTALVGQQSVNINNLLKGGAFAPTLFPLIKLPIFTGGKLTANFKAKVASYESAVYAYNELLLKAANDVISGVTEVVTTNEKLKYHNEQVEFTKKDYDLIYARYKYGIDSMISVIQSDEKYLWAKFHQIDLQRDRFKSSVRLVKALGGGYTNDQGEKLVEKT